MELQCKTQYVVLKIVFGSSRDWWFDIVNLLASWFDLGIVIKT